MNNQYLEIREERFGFASVEVGQGTVVVRSRACFAELMKHPSVGTRLGQAPGKLSLLKQGTHAAASMPSVCLSAQKYTTNPSAAILPLASHLESGFWET